MELVVVSHSYQDEGWWQSKFIGVFSSPALATDVVERLKEVTGFVKVPEGFVFEQFVLNEVQWPPRLILKNAL